MAAGPEILIPLAGIGLAAFAVWTRHQRRLAELRATGESAEVGRVLDTVRRLEERVAVLERVVTDPRQRLADEIDRLR